MSATTAQISPARVAVNQFDPQVGLEHCDDNLCHGLELAEQAVREGANLFLGCSLIAGTNGWPLGEVAGPENQCVLYADLDLSSARSAPIWNSLNDLPRDRRTDLYGPMLGYDLHPALPR